MSAHDATADLPPAVTLVVTAGPHAGTRYTAGPGEPVLVGRAADAHLQLIDDPHFSRHHLMIEFAPPRAVLTDLGSRNGTRLNGRPVRGPCDLADGDEVSGGRTVVRVELPPPSSPPPTATFHPPAAAAGTASFAPAVPSAAAGTVVSPPGTARPPAPDLGPPDPPPDLVPGYELLRRLGHGGMGAVHLARQHGTGRELAVKLMLPESAADDRAVRRFLREVSVLAKLNHPNVVRYEETGTAHGQFYFVMEYVPSVNLWATAAALGPAERVRLVAAVARDALAGLGYAHGQGVVHRDVKPANLLVAHTGDGGTATKVGDFGLAKSFQMAGFSGLTLSGQGAGTLAYMAPEQVTQTRHARPAADLYAVGATVYALLSGRALFPPRPGRDPVRAVLEEEPDPLADLCPWVPPALAAAAHRALDKSPGRRFPDAAAMRAALAPFAGGPA